MMERGQDIVIEKARISDSDAIKQMVISTYAKYVPRMDGQQPAPMTEDYQIIITSQSQQMFVLKTRPKGRRCGWLRLLSDPDDGTTKVNNIVVGPSAQGRGYGRILMTFVEDVARERGRTAMVLFTNEKTTGNIALYERMGFVETGRREENGYKRVYFCKDLVPTGPP